MKTLIRKTLVAIGTFLQIPLGGFFRFPEQIEYQDNGVNYYKAKGQSITVESWNIYGLPQANKYWDRDLSDVIHKIKLSTADVFLIQEGFTKSHRRLFNEAGYKYVLKAPKPWTRFMGSGLWILSRYPITRYDFIPFDVGAAEDKLAQKGILYAEILYKDYRLSVYNTHLQSTSHCFDKDLQEIVHMLQCSQLTEHNVVGQHNYLEILGGDFNTESIFRVESLKEMAHDRRLIESDTTKNQIDKIFTCADMSLIEGEIKRTSLSDHPIVSSSFAIADIPAQQSLSNEQDPERKTGQ